MAKLSRRWKLFFSYKIWNSCQKVLISTGPFIYRSVHGKGVIKFLKQKTSIYKTTETREISPKELSKRSFHFQTSFRHWQESREAWPSENTVSSLFSSRKRKLVPGALTRTSRVRPCCGMHKHMGAQWEQAGKRLLLPPGAEKGTCILVLAHGATGVLGCVCPLLWRTSLLPHFSNLLEELKWKNHLGIF